MRIDLPPWLLRDPDTRVDHAYLTEDEIAALPDGVFYKRKAALTRQRYVQATLHLGGVAARVEVVDDRGSWRITAAECAKLRSRLDGDPASATVTDDDGLLRLLGLADTVRPVGVPLPPSQVRHPRSYRDITRLYRHYSDMEEQGHFADDSPDLDRLLAVLARTPVRSRVLDLGCNSGAFGARLIREKDCAVVGVDLAHDLVVAARAKGVDAVRAFAEHAPFASATFDVVLCCELLEHVLDPDALVREARRLIRPGGLLLVTVPHADGEWGDRDVPYHPEHLRAYHEAGIESLLRGHGLRVTRTLVHHYGHADPQELIVSAVRDPGR